MAAMTRRTACILALSALAVSALSLVAQRTPDFDPTAWLIWGEQLSDGELRTLGGPSWKPLPVLFTTPLALLGDTAAEWLWLVIARTGGLLAIPMAYVVARRLGGATSGWIAAAGLALATGFLYNAARGDSEGLLVLAALAAVHLHLDDRRETALLAGAVAGLIRPEVWPLLAVYGLWLLRRRAGARTVALLAGGREAVVRCGPIGASHFASQMVARRLDVLQEDVSRGNAVDRGTVFATIGTGGARRQVLPVRLRLGNWVLRSSCPLTG